jgi:hypothetical protein
LRSSGGCADLHRVGGYVVPADPGLPAVRFQQGGQHPDRRGLAGAVGAEQGEDGAGPGGEINAAQRLRAAEALGQRFRLDRVSHVPSPS